MAANYVRYPDPSIGDCPDHKGLTDVTQRSGFTDHSRPKSLTHDVFRRVCHNFIEFLKNTNAAQIETPWSKTWRNGDQVSR